MKESPRRGFSSILTELDRSFSLGVKFIVPFIAIMLVSVGAVVWIEYRLQRGEINDGYVEQAEILARSFAVGLEDYRARGHLDSPGDLGQHIRQVMALDPSVRRASVYVPQEEGVVTVASSDSSLVGQPAEPYDARPLYTGLTEIKTTRLGDEKALEILEPMRIGGEIVASLGLYVSLEERDAALQALAIRLTVAPALAVILTGAGVWLTLRILVLRRLRRMVRAGEALAQGDMTSRVAGRWENPGRDEMVMAIHRFNSMAESIQSLTVKLEHLGVTDGLTGICNRRFFDGILPHEINRSHRLGAPVALLILDIDHFKQFNDRFGHPAGDVALRGVARTLARHLRTMDSISRYGGEEFAVILPGSSRASALTTAERLRSAVESTAFRVADEDRRLTVSVGVAACPEDARDASALLSAADAALYAAKRAGRNTVMAVETVTSSR